MLVREFNNSNWFLTGEGCASLLVALLPHVKCHPLAPTLLIALLMFVLIKPAALSHQNKSFPCPPQRARCRQRGDQHGQAVPCCQPSPHSVPQFPPWLEQRSH